MEEWIASKDSIEEIMHAIRHFLEDINASSGRVYLAEDLLSEEKNDYCNCTELALDWSRKNGSGDVKMLIPLQYQKHRMGYCVVSGVNLLLQTGKLEAFFRSVCYSIENCIQRYRYKDINQKYQRLYRIDQLTGIYNRFGMEDVGQELYHKNCMEHVNTVFIFCDINRLKYINDTYGHEVGDWVIKMTGQTLGQLEAEDSLPFRFGGDEFIVITKEGSGVDKEMIRNRLTEACREAPAENLVEVSMGVVVAPWDEPENMDHYLGKADEAMYEEKKRFHEKYGDRRRRREDRA
jgi:diguanylate cyclase (GGDEF)-like protein